MQHLQTLGFTRGVNLGGWMSQCDYSEERLERFITEADIAKIASWGLDHVRIPVDYNVFEDGNGGWRDLGFARLNRAVGWCRRHGLNAVIDLHKTAGFSFDQGEAEAGFFDSEAYQERFYRLWEELAKRCAGDPRHVAFELLNEVTEERFIGATIITAPMRCPPWIRLRTAGSFTTSTATSPCVLHTRARAGCLS